MGALIFGGLIASVGLIVYAAYKKLSTPENEKENTSISMFGWIAIILAFIFIIAFVTIMIRG